MVRRRTLLPVLLAAWAGPSLHSAANASPAGVVIGRSPTGAVCLARPIGAVERTWRIACDGERQSQGRVSESVASQALLARMAPGA